MAYTRRMADTSIFLSERARSIRQNVEERKSRGMPVPLIDSLLMAPTSQQQQQQKRKVVHWKNNSPAASSSSVVRETQQPQLPLPVQVQQALPVQVQQAFPVQVQQAPRPVVTQLTRQQQWKQCRKLAAAAVAGVLLLMVFIMAASPWVRHMHFCNEMQMQSKGTSCHKEETMSPSIKLNCECRMCPGDFLFCKDLMCRTSVHLRRRIPPKRIVQINAVHLARAAGGTFSILMIYAADVMMTTLFCAKA